MGLAGCSASKNPRRATPVEADAFFRPSPSPVNPQFVWIQRPCTYYITSAHDGSMLAHGRLSRGQQVMLRSRQAGGWADIQLMTGELASVLSEDVAYRRPGRGEAAADRRRIAARRRSNGLRLAPPADLPEAPLPEAAEAAAGEEGGPPSSVLIPVEEIDSEEE